VLPHVEHLFRNAASRLRTRLLNRCGRDVAVRVSSVEPVRIGEAFDRTSTKGAAAVAARIAPADLVGFLLFEGNLVRRLVGLLLGDDGTGPEDRAGRPFTSFDLRLLASIAQDLLDATTGAVTMPGKVVAHLDSVVATPRAALTLPRGTSMVEITLDLGPPSAPLGLISVLLPTQATGILWPERDLRRAREAESSGIGRVMPVRVDVVAELARTQITLGELRRLSVGTSIDLGAVGEVRVCISGRPTLLAQPGDVDGVRSIKVVRRLEAAA
jgi:flagellar motor switch protein FliM